MIGTLDYMAPEQMVGGACTGQSDIYTLGIVMYEMIAGARPFAEASSPAAALAAMLRTRPPSLALRAAVPPELDAIVMQCLDPDLKRRYPDVATLGAALDRVLEEGDGTEVTRTIGDSEDEVTRMVTVADHDERTLFAPPPPARVPTPARTPAPPPGLAPTHGGWGSQPGMLPPTHGGQGAAPYAGPAPAPGLAPPYPPPADPRSSLARPPDPPQAYPPRGPGFDMAARAARDASIRRVVWIVVLVVGALVGVVLASQV